MARLVDAFWQEKFGNPQLSKRSEANKVYQTKFANEFVEWLLNKAATEEEILDEGLRMADELDEYPEGIQKGFELGVQFCKKMIKQRLDEV